MKSQREENNELKVFISNRESICGECGENLGSHAWITLACADLDHLLFLAAGDPALTRRAQIFDPGGGRVAMESSAQTL